MPRVYCFGGYMLICRLVVFFVIFSTPLYAQSNVSPWHPIGRYNHEPIRESSGVAASRQYKDVYWTLNDSGNPNVLYATRIDGSLIGEFSVEGAQNSDWEALGIDDEGQLWIGDIGNSSY